MFRKTSRTTYQDSGSHPSQPPEQKLKKSITKNRMEHAKNSSNKYKHGCNDFLNKLRNNSRLKAYRIDHATPTSTLKLTYTSTSRKNQSPTTTFHTPNTRRSRHQLQSHIFLRQTTFSTRTLILTFLCEVVNLFSFDTIASRLSHTHTHTHSKVSHKSFHEQISNYTAIQLSSYPAIQLSTYRATQLSCYPAIKV